MQRALVDTGVLYGAFLHRDHHHDTALAIVRAADDGELPVLVVVDFVLAETLNALTRQLDHGDAVQALSMLEESTGFTIERTTATEWTRGLATYREQGQLSLVDSLLVASAEENERPHLYSFDDGFDSVRGVKRLNAATNPYAT